MKIKKIIRNDEKSTFSAIEEKWKLEMTEVQVEMQNFLIVFKKIYR